MERPYNNPENWNEVQRSLSSEYRLPSVRVYDSGEYHCAAATPDNTVYRWSSTITIQIPEMFSKPELRVSSNPITEGSALTLTCGTTPSTVSTGELQFAFYWDGQELQGFTSSNQYRVYSVQLEDSGNYSCEVQHPAKRILKTSELFYIQVVGGAVRPVVSLSPNWANILTGDWVTLTCDVGSTAGTAPRYSWYKDNKMMNKDTPTKEYIIYYALETNSGTYQCQTGTSERSEPVSLSVTDGPLILQAPPYVYEGDSLTMRCYSKSGGDTVFYKDNNPVAPTYGDQLHTEGVNMTVTGTYRCSKGKTYQSDSVFISVRELFSRPEIKVRPSPLAEGSNMTITCDTALHPSRITTPLQFAFYINGNTVREFSLSRIYRVYSAGPGDWGDYSCAVRTPTGTVLKLSNVTQIHEKGKNFLLSVGLPLLVILIIIIAVGIYKLRHKAGQTRRSSDQSNTGIPLSETQALAEDGDSQPHPASPAPPPTATDNTLVPSAGGSSSDGTEDMKPEGI
uniref:Ig-like domain-containing protein n=1 Tax=Xenopus tropicalis TaxID=8364 RepID=F6XH95_XENTR